MSNGDTCRFCGDPALESRIEELEEELDRFRNGYQGACYACELVGELNVKLEAEVEAVVAVLNTPHPTKRIAELEAQIAEHELLSRPRDIHRLRILELEAHIKLQDEALRRQEAKQSTSNKGGGGCYGGGFGDDDYER